MLLIDVASWGLLQPAFAFLKTRSASVRSSRKVNIDYLADLRKCNIPAFLMKKHMHSDLEVRIKDISA